jgi:pimeloyl-ACP methyl ester carboxylesterase
VFTTNDLWLQFAAQTNAVSALVIHTPWDTSGSNFIFDVFATTNLLGTGPGLNATNWMFVTRSAPGQTNLTVSPLPGAPVCFYRLGTMQDSDNDGLTDAYEKLVSHTNPNLWDSDGDGVGDGDEISPSGLPWRLEAVRRSMAVIYANVPTVTQGGGSGQCTVYLPNPAPAGGATVQYYLSGTAILNADYTVSPTANQVVVPAGSSTAAITFSTIGTGTYADIGLFADITLTNCSSCPVDGTPAEVKIVDTGLPDVRVYALPPWVRRPSATYGTNVAGFYFIRGGPSTNSLTVNLSTSGSTAVSGSDYTALPSSITFNANVRTNWLPLSITPNSTNTADKTLVLTMTSASGYQIDATYGAATVTIAATASPVLPVVQVTATDIDVTTNSPGQFTFTRSFATTSALRVYYHVWGDTNTVISSTNGQDTTLYTGLPGYVDIPANATNVTTSVTASKPISTCQSVTVVLAAGDYSIGNSNMDTVYVDGTGGFTLLMGVTKVGVFGASASQPAELTLIRLGSALSPLTMNWVTTYPYGDNSIQGTHAGSYTWAARQSVLKVQLSTSFSSPIPDTYGSQALPTLTVSNALGTFATAVPYYPPGDMFTVYGLTPPAITVAEGSTGYLTVGRPHPNGQTATAYLTVAGSASNGADFSISTAVAFGVNVASVQVPVQAFSNSQPLGWRTAVVSVNNTGGSEVGVSGSERMFVRIQDPQNAVSDTDIDGDGLPDGFELSNLGNGFDPTVPNDPYVDADQDGLSLIEELELGSNPNVADAPPVYPSIDDSDYVPLTMRVGAVGKMLVQPAENCALCHEVFLRAGNYIHSSLQDSRTNNPSVTDNLIRFLRGTNYQVQVTCNPFYQSLLTSNQAAAITTSPHYTAAYIAEFLSSTNGSGGIYPFIVDTNHLLGTNLSLVQEVLPKRAMLFIPDMTIAADVDRNGTIAFTNRNDRTYPTNPFVFWINDDCDTNSDDTAADLNPSANPPDSANNSIGNLRDLEDFARLQFKIDGLPQRFLTNGNYQVKIYLTNLVGSPSIRLFPAADSNGGLGYLTNTTTATAQIAAPMIGILTNGTPLNIASTNWLGAGANSFFLPMIFEGISTGSCVITFGFSTNNQPPVAVSRPFYLNLQEVTSLYEHWTVGDNTNTDWTQIPSYPSRTADSGVYPAPQTTNDFDYIVFVHGWRMMPWERRAFASTAYKRMWQLGYKGRFVLYSWPTDYTGTSFWDMLDSQDNRQNYDRSEQRAWKSGVGLFELLADMNDAEPPNRVRLIAHSMGNIVASEALRLANVIGVRLPIVQSYIASQAASVANAYDAVNPAFVSQALPPFYYTTPEIYANFMRNSTNQPYFIGMKSAVQGTNIFNFNNRVDYALSSTFAWQANQETKPDIGWYCQFVATNTVNTNSAHTYWRGNAKLLLDGEDSHDQTYEIFAHISQAESKALGCAEDPTHHIRGEIAGSVDLNVAPFNYGNNSYEHSAEFNSINMNRRTYWWQVLSTFSLTNGLPQP